MPSDTVPPLADRHQRGVALAIRTQIGGGVLMSLGARDYSYWGIERGALRFVARILPMRRDGSRSDYPRRMIVQVVLTARDTYDVRVWYRDAYRGEIVHYEAEDVYADQLARLLLALDWDGDEPLNPRYL